MRQSFSLKSQLLFFSSLSFAVLGVLLIIQYSQLLTSSSEKADQFVNSIFLQFYNTIDGRQQELARILTTTGNDQALQDHLQAHTPLEKYTSYRVLHANLVNYSGLARGVEDFILLSENGRSLSLPSNPEYLAWVEEFSRKISPDYFVSDVRRISLGGQSSNSFLMGIQVGFSPSGNLQQATLVVRVNPQTLFPLTDEIGLSPGWHYYITSREGTVLASDVSTAKYLPLVLSSPDSLILRRMLSFLGGEVILEVPRGFMNRELIQVQIGTAFLYTAIYLILFLVNWRFVRKISRTHTTLLESIEAISHSGDGTQGPAVVLGGYREAETLANGFNAMNSALITMRQRVVEEQSAKVQLELRAKIAQNEYLLAQVNPHFLYNAFETIRGLAFKTGQKEIAEITEALTRIFRYSLKAETMVPLSEEIKTVKAYLKIQETRFAGRFCTEYQLDEPMMECLVPKMILQPIVENAVVHGLEGLLGQGELALVVEDFEGLLRVTISDNGVGMSPEKMAEQLHRLSRQVDDPDRSHIGMRSVQDRLRIAFGESGRFSLESSDRPPTGTKVILMMPGLGDVKKEVASVSDPRR